MKKIIFLCFLLIGLASVAQYNPDAPWMQSLQSKNGNATMKEMKDAFDQYWLHHDRSIKGSGYKPFMRWVNNQESQLHDDGTVLESNELLAIYNQKKQGQTNRSVATTSNWQPVFGTLPYINSGSWSSGQGRIQAVTVDPNNASIIYAGTPAGGVWKSTNAGTSFVQLFDEFPQIGVSGIAVDPNNSNIVYIVTGDRDHSDTTFIGVYKSINGGATWTTTGTISGGSRASDIYVNPLDSNMVWVATSNGLYKSVNAGTSWIRTLTGNIKDIKIKPTDPTVVYAVSSSVFYRSTDSGATFTAITAGLPASSGRLVIDVTPADPNYVYILSAGIYPDYDYQGIYKSTDSGLNFTVTGNTTDILESNQAWYDLALAVSTTNAEEIYTGCLNVWKSTNGGTSFTKMNNWSSPSAVSYTHADIHILRFFGTKLYCGSDGGIYVSSNGGTNFTDLTKTIQNGIIYKLAVAKQTSSKMMTGHQDNGGHAFNANQWKNYYGADGMDVAISPLNENLSYGFIQYGGSLYKSTNAGTSSGVSIADAPTAETGTNDDGGCWVTPLEINSLGELFAGYSRLYKSTGGAWVQQSVSTIGTGNLILIAIDPSNDNIMYVSNENRSELYKSTDKGINFTLVYTAPTTISNICIHSTDSNIIYLLTAGTSGQALKSIDGGTTFSNIATGLPSIGKFCIKHQAGNANNPLFIGTNLGVYYKDDTTASWTAFDTNLPNVKVTDLEINYVDNNITASTFGRGVWQSPLPTPLGTKEFQLQNIGIYPNPSSGIFSIQLGQIIPKNIEIFDLTGKTIYAKNEFDKNKEIVLNLSSISNGIYFIKIATDTQSLVKKIIKN
jgi:hypothetical protein